MKIPSWAPIAYILAVSVAVFATDHPIAVLSLLGTQFILLLFLRVPLTKLKPLKRVLNFIGVILFFYAFFSGANNFVLFSVSDWEFGISYDGCVNGLLMGTKIVSIMG